MGFKQNHSKKVLVTLFLVSIICISFVSAITGSIGNARMILRVEQGDTIDRSILVKNVNDVAVNVEVFASGDLEGDFNIRDPSFRLEAGEDKKAFFDVKIKDAGTTETAINVKFSPIDGGNGVGLMSTVIIIANESEGGGLLDNLFGGGGDTIDEIDDEDEIEGEKSSMELSIGVVVILLLVVFVVLLVVVLRMVIGNKSKKKCVKGE